MQELILSSGGGRAAADLGQLLAGHTAVSLPAAMQLKVHVGDTRKRVTCSTVDCFDDEPKLKVDGVS